MQVAWFLRMEHLLGSLLLPAFPGPIFPTCLWRWQHKCRQLWGPTGTKRGKEPGGLGAGLKRSDPDTEHSDKEGVGPCGQSF